MNINNELNELFLKDMAYAFMTKQFESDPQTLKMSEIYERHGIDKQKAIAILMDIATNNELQQGQHDLESVINQFDSKMQRVFNRIEQVDKKLERIVNKFNGGGTE